MNAAATKGVLSTAERAAPNGQRLPISPLLTIMVVTCAGTMAKVQSQSPRRARNPSAADTSRTAGRPIVQNCGLSQASPRPLRA